MILNDNATDDERQRPSLRRQGPGHRRALRRSARPRGGSVDRREVPNPGARPHAARLAHEARPRRDETHDYKRNGTTTLFAALDVLEGKVVGRCMQRHRHQEFIRFLNAVDKTVPASKAMHVILDNYAAHKHPKVIAWLARHPRVTFHFTPTGASWLNAVEGFFATLTKRRLRRGAFLGVVDLQSAINQYLAEHNVDPKPFKWQAHPDTIIAAAARGHQTLDSIH